MNMKSKESFRDIPYFLHSSSTKPLLIYTDKSASASPLVSPTFRPQLYSYHSKLPRRAYRIAVYGLTCVFVLAILCTWSAHRMDDVSRRVAAPRLSTVTGIFTDIEEQNENQQTQTQTEEAEQKVTVQEDVLPPSSHSPWVFGPPTLKFRDNLRPELKYITSWLAAGWNNDVMTFMNLIYLGHITDRVPILPMFTPSWHIGHDTPVITFGAVFDVPRFIQESGIPILEWHEVKLPYDPSFTNATYDKVSDHDTVENAHSEASNPTLEPLGCWNLWQAVQHSDPKPRGSPIPALLGLDLSYTLSPDWVKMIPGYEHDKGASFWALARLAYGKDREENLGRGMTRSDVRGELRDPDTDVLCFDYLYYVGGHQMMEYEYDYSPAWRYVGKHLHWTDHVERIADAYTRNVLGIPDDDEVPPYITVHVRHGDFSDWCWTAEKFEDCFAPLEAIVRRVREVQEELQESRGVSVPDGHVIMTSDETDEGWWQAVMELGWRRIRHKEMRTEERFGKWYTVIIDAAIQSNSLGFVGTDRSTFSMLSRRRVMDWQDGAVRMVMWGRKGADDH